MVAQTRVRFLRALLALESSLAVAAIVDFAVDRTWAVLLVLVAGGGMSLSLISDRAQRRRIFGLDPADGSDDDGAS